MARKQPQLRLNFDAPPKVYKRKPIGRPRAPRVIVQCARCSTPLERYASQIAKLKPHRFFCSECYRRERSGIGLKPRHAPRRELARIHNGQHARLDDHGYVLIYEPSLARPSSSRPKGFELEHRIVATRAIGRRIRKGEHVHHVNGIKTDNRPENLQVLSQQAHRKIHNDEIAAKLQRLADYERLFGPLREGPVTEANLHTLRTKGIQ